MDRNASFLAGDKAGSADLQSFAAVHPGHLSDAPVRQLQAVEVGFTPRTEDLLEPGWAVTWSASVGAAVSGDTYLVTEGGPRPVTPPEAWPVKRIRIQGADCIRPDILVR